MYTVGKFVKVVVYNGEVGKEIQFYRVHVSMRKTGTFFETNLE
jgi:hypothetical protein